MRRDLVETAPAIFHRTCLGEVEIPEGVRLQIEGEFVEALRDLHLPVQRLVKIGLSVAVQIPQASNPVALGNVDFALHNFEPKWVIEPARKTLPSNVLEISLEPGDDKYIAMERGNGGAPVRKKIKTREV